MSRSVQYFCNRPDPCSKYSPTAPVLIIGDGDKNDDQDGYIQNGKNFRFHLELCKRGNHLRRFYRESGSELIQMKVDFLHAVEGLCKTKKNETGAGFRHILPKVKRLALAAGLRCETMIALIVAIGFARAGLRVWRGKPAPANAVFHSLPLSIKPPFAFEIPVLRSGNQDHQADDEDEAGAG